MAFVAVNTDVIREEMTLEQNLQYSELSEEYNEILALCRQDEGLAWSKLEEILEGELFTEGPKFNYQPAISELQQSFLALAYDLSKRVEPGSVVNLAIETAEWFPKQAVSWINLADSLDGDLKNVAVKRIATKMALQLSPIDRKLQAKMREISQVLGSLSGYKDRLGKIKKSTATSQDYENVTAATVHLLTGPSIVVVRPAGCSAMQKNYIEVAEDTRVSQLIVKVCDLAEEILEMSTKKSRFGSTLDGSNALLYSAKLAAPIEIRVIFEKTNEPPTLSLVDKIVEDNTLFLSQPESLKNIQEYSQVHTRSQTRKLRQRDTSDGDRMGVKELCVRWALLLQDVHEADEFFISSALDDALRLRDSGTLTQLNCALSSDSGSDPSIAELSLSLDDCVGMLMINIMEVLLKGYSNNRWSNELLEACKRIALIAEEHVEFFTERAPDIVLLWLAEFLCGQRQKDTSGVLAYILTRLEILIVKPRVDPNLLVRFIWCRFIVENDLKFIEQILLIYAALPQRQQTIIIAGVSDGTLKEISPTVIKAACAKRERRDAMLRAIECLSSAESGVAELWIKSTPDIIAWLRENYKDAKFCELVALLIDKVACNDTKLECLVFALVKSVDGGEECSPAILEALLEFPNVWPVLSRSTEFLESFLTLNHGFLTIVSMVKTFSRYRLLDKGADLLIVIWRDFLLAEKLYLKDPRLLTLLLELFVENDWGKENGAVTVLEYCSLRVMGGTTYLDIADEWSLIKKLGEEKCFSLGLSHTQVSRLFDIASRLVDFSTLDPAKVILFVDQLLDLYGHLDTNPRISLAKRQIWKSLTLTLKLESWLDHLSWMVYVPVRILKQYRVIAEALQVKAGATARLPNLKKKGAEFLQSQREELLFRIILEQSPANRKQLLWDLGCTFDAEIHLLLSRDAAMMLDQAKNLQKLATYCFNCWAASMAHSLDDDVEKVLKILTLLRSITGGTLSFFFTLPISKRRAGFFLLGLIESCSGGWKKDTVRAVGLKWIGADLNAVVEARFRALKDQMSMDGRPTEWIYHNIYKITSIIFKVCESQSHLAETWLGRLERALSNELVPRETPMHELGPRDRIGLLLQWLGGLDRKKTQHLHLFLLARISEQSSAYEAVKKAWAKLLPVLVKSKSKSKSSQLASVWQNDQDYVGDYLWYVEKYVREGCHALATCKNRFTTTVEDLAMVLGRVPASTNVVIRKRQLMADLANLLAQTVSAVGQDAEESISDFLDPQADSGKQVVARVAREVVEILQGSGVKVPSELLTLFNK